MNRSSSVDFDNPKEILLAAARHCHQDGSDWNAAKLMLKIADDMAEIARAAYKPWEIDRTGLILPPGEKHPPKRKRQKK
jgi:hypothetical protein